jgi:hypothetical protein
VLLLDERESGPTIDRVLAHGSLSSCAALRHRRADAVASIEESTIGIA